MLLSTFVLLIFSTLVDGPPFLSLILDLLFLANKFLMSMPCMYFYKIFLYCHNQLAITLGLGIVPLGLRSLNFLISFAVSHSRKDNNTSI